VFLDFFKRYPFVIFLILLSAGILVPANPLVLFGGLFSGILLSLAQTKARYIGYFVLIFCFGIATRLLHHSEPPSISNTSAKSCHIIEIEKKSISQKSEKWICTILDHKDTEYVNQKLLVTLKQESIYQPGDILSVIGKAHLIPQPSIPDQFSFRDYYAQKDIYLQMYLFDDLKIEHIGQAKNWNYYIQKFRQRLSVRINLLFPHNNVKGIVQALLIGDKSLISVDQKNEYSSAGIIHILAVSGLHVGLFYLLIITLLKPIRNQGVKLFFVITGLICYAAITGFTPSVVRAGVMFGVFAIANALKRDSDSIHTLFVASFFILLFNPNFIFEAGFQLSFVAVLGILTFYTPLYRLLNFKHKFVSYIWSLICVSFVAQLSTAPLVIYYFNFLPVYFLISNLVVIILTQIALIVSAIAVSVSFLSLTLGNWLAIIGNAFVVGINWVAHCISELPLSRIEGLHFNFSQVILFYGLLLFFWLSISYRARIYQILSVICAFVIVGISINRWKTTQLQDYWSFHKMGKSVIIERTVGSNCLMMVSDSIDESRIEHLMRSYIAKRNLEARYIMGFSSDISCDGLSIGTANSEPTDIYIKKLQRGFHIYGNDNLIFSNKNTKSLTLSKEEMKALLKKNNIENTSSNSNME